MSEPTCACGKTMTRENSTLRPEFFLCDECARQAMKRYKVPEGMLKAAAERVMGIDLRFKMGSEEALLAALEAALKWLAQNPIRPTDQQAAQLWKVAMELDPDRNEDTDAAVNLVLAWQRMMFLEPETPEAVKDLLWDGTNDLEDESNRRVVEAYRRGRAG